MFDGQRLTYNGLMRFDLFQLMLALWFLSLGFVLFRRANRVLDQHRCSGGMHTQDSN